ncbi:arabinan endo-1,5-alpha-L-arabinosidase [Microbacterium sp. 22242]|uniref:arabinan endo-1,5-alpha-L-arabinosidase n=1 Tax=Microbacterium sp. 22242 TaxID=3453896 RepID=UPI003F84F085
MSTASLTAEAAAALAGTRGAHDPTVVRGENGLWYMFGTDAAPGVADIPAGAHVRTSPDLVRWSFAGTALDGVPAAAAEWSGASGLWAPEVVRWPSGGWHMYYSASTFGSRTSAIGLASAETPAGPWTDRGIVIATRHDRDAHNAIDAAVTFDREGRPWLAYGSFFDGIRIVELDPVTGLRAGEEQGALIARRPASVDGAIEGAYILYRAEEDRYVLFCSYDSLASTYSVRVGASREITGPYLDANDRPLVAAEGQDPLETGTKVLGGHRFPGGTGLIAPGHNSILRDGDATFMVHHVRLADDPAQHEAQIRRLHFTSSGWPVVSPHPFAGAERELLDAPAAVAGRWQVIRWDPRDAGMLASTRAEVVRTGLLTDGEPASATLRLQVDATDEGEGRRVDLDAVVFGAWDPVAARTVLVFGGIDADGIVWSGSQEAIA